MKRNIIGLFIFVAMLSACQNKTQTKEKTESGNTPVEVKQDSLFYDEHNTKNSVDWAGTYEGTLPCADCSGIHVIITLKSDDTYEKSEQYLEKGDPIKVTGQFTWTPDGGSIIIQEKDRETKYRVGEGIMKMLDMQGKEVQGELAEFYDLKKIK